MRQRWIIVWIIIMCTSINHAQSEIIPIDIETVTGEITAADAIQRYRFTAEATQTYIITMEATGGDLDPQLFLLDADGQPIDENDDIDTASGNRDARIVFTPDVSGTYIIDATRFLQSTGTYRLTLALDADIETADLPDFDVAFTQIQYLLPAQGTINAENPIQYFVFRGTQGELVQFTADATSADFTPNLTVYTDAFTALDRLVQNTATRQVVNAVIPQDDWYLIEVTGREASVGTFTLVARRASNTVLQEASPIQATFTPEQQTLTFIVNATINERLFINLSQLTGDDIETRITVRDLGQEPIDLRRATPTQVLVDVPRSGAYLVEVRNVSDNDTASGGFRISLRRSTFDITKLQLTDVSYFNDYTGTITDRNAIDYYRLSGKRDEIVTVVMESVGADNGLDPFLILMDSDLNEIAFNDNAGAARTAQIAQFELPYNGDYYILATRADLETGATSGAYSMQITAGQIQPEAGNLTATLRWTGSADLNLFVTTPDGQRISWANPTSASGRTQVTSNTNCEIISNQPIEHIYFPDTLPRSDENDYIIWAWYQDDCDTADETEFDLLITLDGEPYIERTAILSIGQRFETSFRLSSQQDAQIVERGSITSPSPQQTASQGGDTLIVYGQTLTGTLNDAVYARFYQFTGNAGDRVQITVERTTNNLDPIVVLRDETGENLAIDDDGGTGRNATLDYTLPDDGRYIIGVTRFGLREGRTFGNYRLSLTQAP